MDFLFRKLSLPSLYNVETASTPEVQDMKMIKKVTQLWLLGDSLNYMKQCIRVWQITSCQGCWTES